MENKNYIPAEEIFDWMNKDFFMLKSRLNKFLGICFPHMREPIEKRIKNLRKEIIERYLDFSPGKQVWEVDHAWRNFVIDQKAKKKLEKESKIAKKKRMLNPQLQIPFKGRTMSEGKSSKK